MGGPGRMEGGDESQVKSQTFWRDKDPELHRILIFSFHFL